MLSGRAASALLVAADDTSIRIARGCSHETHATREPPADLFSGLSRPRTFFLPGEFFLFCAIENWGRRSEVRRLPMQAQEMISTHPEVRGQTNDALIRCIEECYSCAQTCTSCADACLAEDMVKSLTQCIRLNLDCADVCNTTGRLATRRTGSDEEMIRRMLDTCAAACQLCGDECDKHAIKHEHCRICAAARRECMQAC